MKSSCSKHLLNRPESFESVALTALVIEEEGSVWSFNCDVRGKLTPGILILSCGSGSYECKGRTSHSKRVDGKRENLPKTQSVRGAHNILLTVENCKYERSLLTCQLSRPLLSRWVPSLALPGWTSHCPRASQLVSPRPTVGRVSQVFQCFPRTLSVTSDFKKDIYWLKHCKDVGWKFLQAWLDPGDSVCLCLVYSS